MYQLPTRLFAYNYPHAHTIVALYYSCPILSIYRDSQTLGEVNNEAICRSAIRPCEGKFQVSVKPMKVTEVPDHLLEHVNRKYQHYR